jgi:hypothetical protein
LGRRKGRGGEEEWGGVRLWRVVVVCGGAVVVCRGGVVEGHFLLSHRSTYKASIYSIALNAATSSDLHSLVMQHPPILCFQSVLAFAIVRPLP